jgi:hypothetical protein
MSGEMIVVAVIIALAAAYAGWTVWKSFQNGGEDCGCGTCDVKKTTRKVR